MMSDRRVRFYRMSLLVALVSLVGCTTYEKPVAQVDPIRLKAVVTELATIEPARSFAHPQSLDKAAALIRRRFKAMGYDAVDQTYEVKGDTMRNVIATLGPRKAPRYVVGAHYDVCGDQPGADDNASGVAGMLELARLLKPYEKKLTHGIDFVAYTLEEPPTFRTPNMGSFVHAKSLKDAKVDVKGAIVLEMIGYFTDEKQAYPIALLGWFYPSKGNFIAVVGGFTDWGLNNDVRRGLAMSECPVSSIKAPSFIPGIDYSDHANYWKFGYDAVMVTDTAFNRNDNYHRHSDTPDTLNYRIMAEVVKGVFWTIYNEATR